MFDYVVGNVVDRGDEFIVLDRDGFGLRVYVPSPEEFEGEVKVFLYLHLKEDSIKLYGFKTIQERQLFLKLISIYGIGVKHAFSILSNISIQEFLKAIETEGTTTLSSLPGIGKKTAHRVIVELKGKLNFERNKKLEELLEALSSLGYEKKEVIDVAKEVIKENKSIEESLKEVLRRLQS